MMDPFSTFFKTFLTMVLTPGRAQSLDDTDRHRAGSPRLVTVIVAAVLMVAVAAAVLFGVLFRHRADDH